MIVEDPVMSRFNNKILVEWAIEWSHTANFEDFTVQAMNHDGFYVPINCLEHFYSELMDDLFGCEIEPNYMTEYEFSQDYIRI